MKKAMTVLLIICICLGTFVACDGGILGLGKITYSVTPNNVDHTLKVGWSMGPYSYLITYQFNDAETELTGASCILTVPGISATELEEIAAEIRAGGDSATVNGNTISIDVSADYFDEEGDPIDTFTLSELQSLFESGLAELPI